MTPKLTLVAVPPVADDGQGEGVQHGGNRSPLRGGSNRLTGAPARAFVECSATPIDQLLSNSASLSTYAGSIGPARGSKPRTHRRTSTRPLASSSPLHQASGRARRRHRRLSRSPAPPRRHVHQPRAPECCRRGQPPQMQSPGPMPLSSQPTDARAVFVASRSSPYKTIEIFSVYVGTPIETLFTPIGIEQLAHIKIDEQRSNRNTPSEEAFRSWPRRLQIHRATRASAGD